MNATAVGDGGLVVDIPLEGIDDRFAWLRDEESGWQYGEQGVLAAIAGSLYGDAKGSCVEIGVGVRGKASITVGGFVEAGWKHILVDSNPASAESWKGQVPVVLQEIGLTPDNCADSILSKSSLPERFEILVIDVDSIDYYIWKSMEKYSADVVCIEHHEICAEHMPNLVFAPHPDVCGMPCSQPDKNGGIIRLQANWRAVAKLGEDKGYVVAWRSRINTILVRKELAEKVHRAAPFRLNIGAGNRPVEGYLSFDIKDGNNAETLPYPDGSVDEIYASHVLEHFPLHRLKFVLEEWNRALKPGGRLRVAVPNFEHLVKVRNAENWHYTDRVIVGGWSNDNDKHGAVFCEQSLAERLNAAGFEDVVRFNSFANDCSSLDLSLNMEGRKRWFHPIKDPKIGMIMNYPRLGFTDNFDRLIQLAHHLKFKLYRSRGAFWDRDMSITTEQAVNDGMDILLYVDFDSLFDSDDATKIIDHLNNSPQLAAVFPVQMSRGTGKPLVFDNRIPYYDEHLNAKFDYSGKTAKVQFGHFGLTAIRAQVFKKMPHPWFWSIPGPDGKWTGYPESDADITFWRQMYRMGYKVEQHNEVVIGHMVVSVLWPKDAEGGRQIQPIETYQMKGKPKDAKFNAKWYRKKSESKDQPPAKPEVVLDASEHVNGVHKPEESLSLPRA